MSVIRELESVVDQIYALAEDLGNFAIPAISVDAVDALLRGEETVYSEDSLPVPDGVSASSSGTVFSASEQNRIVLNGRIVAIKGAIRRISNAIDNTDESIPLDGYRRLVDRIKRANVGIRYAGYAINDELRKQEIRREHHLRFKTLRTGYQELLKGLNECVSKYNVRYRNRPLSPKFSIDASPIKGVLNSIVLILTSIHSYFKSLILHFKYKGVTLESLGVTECVDPPKWSLPYEFTEEYAKSCLEEEKFRAINEANVLLGNKPFTYREYLEWRKT